MSGFLLLLSEFEGKRGVTNLGHLEAAAIFFFHRDTKATYMHDRFYVGIVYVRKAAFESGLWHAWHREEEVSSVTGVTVWISSVACVTSNHVFLCKPVRTCLRQALAGRVSIIFGCWTGFIARVYCMYVTQLGARDCEKNECLLYEAKSASTSSECLPITRQRYNEMRVQTGVHA